MARSSHTSLDRPLATPLEEGLPLGVVPYGPRSSWPLIITMLYQRQGVWFRLERKYTHPSAPLTSARKHADTYLPSGASELLEAGFTPLPGGRVEVYMRIRLPDQRPFYDPTLEEEEEEEVPAPAAPIEPEAQATEPEAPTPDRDELPENVTEAEVAATLGSGYVPPSEDEDAEAPPSANPRQFTAAQVREIRLRREAGETLKTLAEAFGTGVSVISNVANRRTYTWVEDDD